MRKKSREMDAAWALEVMDKAPYITISMTDVNGMPYSVPLSLARTDTDILFSLRYRDEETEGYNITPNFFICPKIEPDNLDFTKHSFAPTDWKFKPNKHFEDRLFDRDTLFLREYEINLIFLIAAYGAYEDCWADSIHKTIREDMIDFLNANYSFFKIEPKDIDLYSQNGKVGTIPFTKYFHAILAGKAYKESDDSNELILAFEKNTPEGKADYDQVRDEIQYAINSSSIDTPVELKK